jgi:hypothetical protein
MQLTHCHSGNFWIFALIKSFFNHFQALFRQPADTILVQLFNTAKPFAVA